MKSIKLTVLMVLAIMMTNCSSDDDGTGTPVVTNSKTYTLGEFGNSGVSGTARFDEQQNGSTIVTLELDGTPQGASHPAHIHMNTAAEGGAIIVPLQPVNGTTGLSSTVVTALEDGSAVSYNDLLTIDAYINVHLSMEDLATIVAQGDIGQNELTGEMKSYSLGEVDAPGISGNLVFEERVNGEALATISLSGTPDGGMHPAHIHANSAAVGGGILYTFAPVNGSTGMSVSNVSMLDDGTSFNYEDVLAVDGYVNVHLSMEELATIVAQGDIGSNELTGESITYPLNEVDAPGISGNITFEERINGFALATISIMNTPADGMHPAHIHENSAAIGGGILYTFKPVNGATGMSVSDTRMGQGEGENSYTYQDILTVNGYVNVHLSMEELATIVAQGDIGSNF